MKEITFARSIIAKYMTRMYIEGQVAKYKPLI
jgi:hypothetical protein